MVAVASSALALAQAAKPSAAVTHGKEHLMTNLRSVVLSLLAGTLTLLASAAAAAPDGAVPTRLRGTYVTTLPTTQSIVPAGRWRLELRRASYRVHNPVSPRAIIPGPLSVSGNRIVFVDRSVDHGCGAAVRGTYRFRLRAGTLRLTKIKDGCKNRIFVFARTWKKKS
jgi:hypothetical protein